MDVNAFKLTEQEEDYEKEGWENKNAIEIRYPAYLMAFLYQQAGHSSSSSLRVLATEVIPKPSRGSDQLKSLLQQATYWIS